MAKATKKIDRTARGLRDAMFDEIDALRNGTGDPQRMKAVASIAREIINTVHAEIAYQKHAAEANETSRTTPRRQLRLGSN